MALSCERHSAFLYDRGGQRQIGSLGPLKRVKWERLRDDISTGTVWIGTPGRECSEALALAEAGRVELVIFRGKERVWEGPVSRIAYQGQDVEIEARDIMWYISRTIMQNEYDNRYPNNGKVLLRLDRVLKAELARKEALDPPVNILPHLNIIMASTEGAEDAGTAAHTVPYELTVFQHIDEYAARGGIDYTVIGRSLMMFDVHQRIGQTPQVTGTDFIGHPIITQYGAELATRIVMTDGKGNWGDAGGIDPYYGEWEVLHQAYDETAPQAAADQPPTVAELRSQAQRSYLQGKVPPLVVRIPDNTRLNPAGVLQVSDLVPGVWIPLSADLPGRSVSQMQKLDKMTVEETPENGETISVVLSPAYPETYVEETP
jgi:hypothetical protein